MAGMFYSLEETAEILKIKQKEVKELIKQDKLREFRIGSDLLLKAEEVEALAAERGISIEPKVQAEEEPASVPAAPETPEPQMEQEETTEPEAGEIEPGEFELPESEAMEPESPVLDMAELENLSVGEEVPAHQADRIGVKTEDVAAAKPTRRGVRRGATASQREASRSPKAASKKRRSKAKRKVARTRSRPRLSIGQWFWKGLTEDNPVAVILLFLLLGIIIIACIAIPSLLYEML